MPLCQFLKEQRQKSCLTQQEAADLLGDYKSQFISSVDLGGRRIIKKNLKRMACVYDVCETEMFNRYVEEAEEQAVKKATDRWNHKEELEIPVFGLLALALQF